MFVNQLPNVGGGRQEGGLSNKGQMTWFWKPWGFFLKQASKRRGFLLLVSQGFLKIIRHRGKGRFHKLLSFLFN